MVAATFSWPVATPAVMAPKATLAQELSQLVPRPQCGKCWHAYRLDIAGAVITDSPPSTPSSWCTALKAGAASLSCCGAALVEGKLLGFDRISQRAPIP